MPKQCHLSGMSTFFNTYKKKKEKIQSLLCVGLDPEPRLLPKGYDGYDDQNGQNGDIASCYTFLEDIIEATAPFCIAYKANCAFFEALGPKGMEFFYNVIQMVKEKAPDSLFISDAKRGDVEHSAKAYAHAFFGKLNSDAITVNPYIGMDCIEPFLTYKKKATMVLCHTSNRGAHYFQSKGETPLYLEVAKAVAERNRTAKNLWLVVGATQDKKKLNFIREMAPEVPFLIPGVGRQGGDLKKCLDAVGNNVLINVGRSLLYSAKKRENVFSEVQKECETLLASFQTYL